MKRMKLLITSVAVTALIAGGGTAIASAATSTSPSTTSSTATKTAAPPARGAAQPGGPNGSKHCPNM